ncbi:interferon-related developmental regulator family protein / IFRD protein family, partial [Thalictrum thalictroides]
DGYDPETTTNIGADVFRIARWSQLMQVNFLKCFLGGGFVKHMQENILLQDVFDCTPKKKSSQP